MKPSAFLAIVIGLSFQFSSFAQLRIVGLNAEAPNSKINYLEHPVSFEQFLPYYSRENSMYYDILPYAGQKTVWPRNEQIYIYPLSNEGFRLSGSTVKVGIPIGYYNISGCILCQEEFEEIKASLRAFLDSYGVDWEIKQNYSNKNWACPSFKTLQEIVNTSKDPQLRVLLYILKDKNGVEYYVWPEFFRHNYDRYVLIDFYNYIQEQYKDQDVLFFNEYKDEFVLDVFKEAKVPIQSAVCNEEAGGRFSEFEDINKMLKNGKKYHCTDVLVNKNDVVLVLDDGNGNTFSVALKESKKIRYSNASLLQEQYTVYLNAVNAIQGPDAYSDALFVISPKELEKTSKEYARIKAGKDLDLARQKEQQRKDIFQRFGDSMGDLILNHKLALGMTPEMCIASIGYPSRRYTNTSDQGVVEIFYYAYMVVHFSNGELVRIEQIQ